MVHADVLTARVAAVNNANRYALELYPKLRAAFEPFVGQKVEKVDGTLLAKVAKGLPNMPFTTTLHVYKLSSDYLIAWVVKACETCPSRDGSSHYANYHETPVYVGNMRDGVLTEMCNPPELRTDYSVEMVELAREVYREAKQRADNAHGNLYPFGEYDR